MELSNNQAKALIETYAHERGITWQVLQAAGCRLTQVYSSKAQKECAALAIPTRHGNRYRFLDPEEAQQKYTSVSGYSPCWHMLDKAIEMGGVPILCNGEISTIAAQFHGLPATCITSGEKATIPPRLLKEFIRTYHGNDVVIAADCDETGAEKAHSIACQLREMEYHVRVLTLPFEANSHNDIADWCKYCVDTGTDPKTIYELPDLPRPAPPPSHRKAKPETSTVVEAIRARFDMLAYAAQAFPGKRIDRRPDHHGEYEVHAMGGMYINPAKGMWSIPANGKGFGGDCFNLVAFVLFGSPERTTGNDFIAVLEVAARFTGVDVPAYNHNGGGDRRSDAPRHAQTPTRHAHDMHNDMHKQHEVFEASQRHVAPTCTPCTPFPDDQETHPDAPSDTHEHAPQHAQTPTRHAHDMHNDMHKQHEVFEALQRHIAPTCTTCTPFPGDVFDHVWKQMVIETSHAIECDPAIAGTTLLAMVSTVIQHNTVILKNVTREVPVTIFATIGAPTGAGKTPIYTYFVKAIDSIEQHLINDWQAQWDAYKRQSRDDEEDSEPTPPADDEPCLYTTDTTSESLHAMLLQNNGIGAVLSDEGDVFNTIMGRYERGGRIANLSTYLKAWDGKSIRVSRGRKTSKVRSSALTVLIQTQPDILREICSKKEVIERGLLPRFLICIAEDTRDKVTGKTTPVRKETLDEYIAVMSTLYHQEKRTLRLHSDADRLVKDYHLTMRQQLKTTYRDVQEYAAKAESQVLRLAALLHCMNAPAGEHTITAQTVQDAIRLFEYYLSFVMHEDILLADKSMGELMVKLIERLPVEIGETFYLSQMKKILHITNRDSTRLQMLEDALTTLCDCGVLQEREMKRKGSRSFVLMVSRDALQNVVHGVHVTEKKDDFIHSNGKSPETGVCACRVHVAENRVHVCGDFVHVAEEVGNANIHPEIASLRESHGHEKKDPTPDAP